MSLDFLAGFTIFMISLIIVVSLIPGLLAGVASSSIDYDAVAYRTAVILVEDPGWPDSPNAWEHYGTAHKDLVERLGLAVSKDAPNILLPAKIDRLFDTTFFTYPDDYRSRVFFTDYPYSFNISLVQPGEDTRYLGEPLPQGQYGYIRRVVKIKEPAVAEINAGSYIAGVDQTFTVTLNYTELLDAAVDPAYRIDPRTEPISINITNFAGCLVNPYVFATLDNITFSVNGVTLPATTDEYTMIKDESYQFFIDGTPADLTPGAPVGSALNLTLKPAWLKNFPVNKGDRNLLTITYRFADDPAQTQIQGDYSFDYTTAAPQLDVAALEVAVW
ncbi:hypothetical protein FGU65_13720 [Methanoculleus sp. FWC-SCC1]|uniref:Uncharacterized protein n=2 Tax=Methanoculleus frigidifontis TaxID=2584085 RepID=A0ABT8MDB8_9EURY|nr:hypothetical protein [Methanoculleus sp. FWC-SCC1]